jgi:SAM-dependent methyltransferase
LDKAKNHKTINDFGNQWKIHGELREDHWTSDQMFRDHFPKDFDFLIFKGAKVLEVGAGSGRILHMVSNYHPSQLIGVEPSDSFENLLLNTKNIPNLHLLNTSGANFHLKNLDVIISLGVIHHIPEADKVLHNIFNSLKKGGYFIMWVYGYENNRTYVALQKILRAFTIFLPDYLLDKFSLIISYMFDFYGIISKNIFSNRLSLSKYYKNVYSMCARKEKKYIIFDQLNPSYSKYYKQHEVYELLKRNGFNNIELYHRHGYSWTAVAIK